MSGLRTKADYLRACEVTKKVIDAWDPYSLLAQGAPPDEYDACAARVVRFIPTMRQPEDAVLALSQVFSEGFEPELFQPDPCQEVGEQLFRALGDAGLLPSTGVPK